MFQKLAIVSARWPYLVLLLCGLSIAACVPGIFQTRFSRRLEELWLPQDSGSALDAQFVTQNFGDVRPSSLIMTARREGDDVITRESLLDLLDLHKQVLALETTVKGTDERVSYNSTCFRVLPLVPCTTLSVLEWWDYDAERIRTDPDLHATLSRPLNGGGVTGLLGAGANLTALWDALDLSSLDLSHPDTLAVQLLGQLLAQLTAGGSPEAAAAARRLREAIVALAGGRAPPDLPGVGPDGELDVDQLLASRTVRQLLPHVLNSSRVLLGNASYDEHGVLLRADAVSQTYVLMAGDERYNEDLAFEASWLADVAQQWPHITVYEYTRRSVNDEGQRGVPQALSLFGISFVTMIVYVSLSLGRLHWVQGRVLLGIGGVVGIVLSTVMAFGVAGYFDVPFTPLVVGTIFLILGIGVDDMYIICNQFDRTPAHWSIERRLVTALREVGSSVTMTSITDLFAFAVSAQNIIPATSGFCTYSALSVLFNYLIQVTFFIALLVLDTRRMNAGRMDICPCRVLDRAAADDYLRIQHEGADNEGLDAAAGGDHADHRDDYDDDDDDDDGDDDNEGVDDERGNGDGDAQENGLPGAKSNRRHKQKKRSMKRRRQGAAGSMLPRDDESMDEDCGEDGGGDDRTRRPADEPRTPERRRGTGHGLKRAATPMSMRMAEASQNRSRIRLSSDDEGDEREHPVKDLRSDWVPEVDPEQYRGNKLTYFVAKYVAPMLMGRAAKACVFLITLLLLAMGMYGAATMGLKHRPGDAALPDDSYLTQFQLERNVYFPDSYDDVYLVFGSFDYSKEELQDEMLAKFELLRGHEDTRAPYSCWLCDFLAWLSRSNHTRALTARGRPRTSSQFYIFLYEWLGSSPTRAVSYSTDLTFQYGLISASRMSAKLKSPGADLSKGALLTEMRAALTSDQLHSFPFAFSFLHWEQYVNMIERNLKNFFWVSLSIFLLTCIFIDSLRCALLILCTIVMIDVEMMFVLSVGGMGLTNISLTLLLLTLGLAIDAVSHVTHSYVSTVKRLALTTTCSDPAVIRRYATSIALIETGTSVFSGSLTSFFGILALSWASQEILREFALFFLTMFVFAMFNGLCFLPVMLSIIGPTSNKRWTRAFDSIRA